jgi:acetyl-CoA carboxylase biotin carboxyl carrier protein
MALNFKDVAEILKIVDASDCEEVVLEVEGTRLVVRKGQGGTNSTPSVGASASTAAPVSLEQPAPAPSDRKTGATSTASTKIEDGLVAVRSPMVGTAYRSPAPDEPPFVEVGTRVEKGAPLCLIEVMKLYTTIKAPSDGVIASIHVDAGALVEFDQILFSISPE